MELIVTLIYGSVRTERKGIRAAKYLLKKLADKGFKTNFIDPKEYRLPLLDKMYKEFENGNAPEILEQISGKISESDGFMIVSGEYNHGVPPALKNLLDHFQKEYFFKPSAIASYSSGRYGGVRATFQLRSILAELGMPAISSAIAFPSVQKAFSEDGAPQQDYIERSADRFLEEFQWYMEAFKNQRLKGTPY